MSVTLTPTQRALYDAYSINVDKDTLKTEMRKYWSHVKTDVDCQNPGHFMYMFTDKPNNSFETFPFIAKKKGELLTSVSRNEDGILNVTENDFDEQYTDTKDEDVKNINYLHRMIKALHYRDPQVGARLINAVKENDLRLANSLMSNFAPKDLIDEMKKIQGDIYKQDQKGMWRLKPTPKRKKVDYDMPVVAASIHIDTSREGFENARYDVSKLIRSIAKFSYGGEDCNTPGNRLQSYHNTLYARAQSTLNRLSHQQESINQYRMRHIKREWDHYAVFCNNDIFRLPPGYNPVPPTNSWITNNNTKFTKMNPAQHNKLLNKKVWDLDDYLYFDPTLVTDNAGFEAWQRWAENEKRKYSIYCLEEFVKPDDWEIPADKTDVNPLEAVTVRFNKLRPFKDRKKVKIPKPPSPVYVPPDLTYLDGMSIEELEDVKADLMLQLQIDGSNGRANFTRAEQERYDRADELIKKKEKEERRRKAAEEEEERKRIAAEEKVGCQNRFNKRVKKLKAALKNGKIEITDTGVKQGNPSTTYTLDVDGMSKLINQCGGEVTCKVEKCTKKHPDMLQEAATKLLKFVQDQGARINTTLMGTAVEKWVTDNRTVLEKLIITKKDTKVVSVKQDGKNEIITDFFELLQGKFSLSIVSKLRGDKSVISELVGTALLPFYREPKVKIILKQESEDRWSYEEGDDTYYLRTIGSTTNEMSHENFINAFHIQIQKGNVFEHIIPVERFNAEKVQNNIITSGNKEFIFNDKDETPMVMPKANAIASFYTQKVVGKSLKDWMEETYYQFPDPLTQDKNDLYHVSVVKNLENTELKDKVFDIIKQGKQAIDQFHSIETGRFVHHDVKIENMTIDDEGIVRLFDFDLVIDTNLSLENNASVIPMKIGEKYLMDRWSDKTAMESMIESENKIFVDYHQWALNTLRLGGVFDWVDTYNFQKVSTTDTRISKRPRAVNNSKNPLNFWNYIKSGIQGAEKIKESNFWKTVIKSKDKGEKRSNEFIQNMRNVSYEHKFKEAFNLSEEAASYIFKELFKLSNEIIPPSVTLGDNGNGRIQSPMQFLSQSRQPVFERVEIQSDYGDEEDLEALMEYDPLLDVDQFGDSSSHISDADFDRMLNEATDYNALSQHIENENKVYSHHSIDVEEDAKSISSKHSNTSEISVASQMSIMSSNSVASNMSSNSVASNMSATSNMSAHSVASNLSAASYKSNMSDMSNHSYSSHTSRQSIESEEAYPTSEHSNGSHGKYSEQSYNQTSTYGDSSGHSSSESSGKELGYSNGLSESGGDEMSESSDHESSNDSMDYSSSGASSSNNHSYNSSSETDS